MTWDFTLARTSGDPGLADDLMQESFVRFWGLAVLMMERWLAASISFGLGRIC